MSLPPFPASVLPLACKLKVWLLSVHLPESFVAHPQCSLWSLKLPCHFAALFHVHPMPLFKLTQHPIFVNARWSLAIRKAMTNLCLIVLSASAPSMCGDYTIKMCSVALLELCFLDQSIAHAYMLVVVLKLETHRLPDPLMNTPL